jgi:hypothetical protein
VTREQELREQSVELLLCAADLAITGSGAFVAAQERLDLIDGCPTCGEIVDTAHAEWIAAEHELATLDLTAEEFGERMWTAMLEAAQRLDEGEGECDVDAE